MRGDNAMGEASKEEVKIAPTYTPIGIGGVSWIVVEPGLFEYPVPEGQKPALFGNRCTKCGRVFFPRRQICPDCFDEGTMEIKGLDSRAVIYSSTVVRIPSPAGLKPPYAYGYVDIPADRIRLHALLEGTDLASLAPGTEVKLVIAPIAVNKQGQQVIGYKFKPIS
jgi:uncharacterized OB-fold protein